MDIAFLLWLQEIREKLGSGVSMLFNGISYLSFLAVVIGVVLYWTMNKKTGYKVLLTLCFGTVVMQTLKNIFCINRPWIRDARIHPYEKALSKATGYSFPSGHTTIASSGFGALIPETKKSGIRILLVVTILLVGFSRNFLGVHTPQDVIVGLLTGFVSVIVINRFIHLVEKAKENRGKTVLMTGVFVAVLTAFTLLKSYPLVYDEGVLIVDPDKMQIDAVKTYGMLFGFALGSALEHKYIGFTTEDLTMKQKVIRILLGSVFAAAFYFLPGMLLKSLLAEWIVALIKSFLVAIAVTFAAPFVFVRIKS